ncbi:hypothetical protein D3C80_2075410 [compost metagenome]
MVGILRRVHRDAFARTKLRHGAIEGVFPGIVGVGEHGGDVITGVEQCFDAGAANIVIGEDNSFCGHGRTR